MTTEGSLSDGFLAAYGLEGLLVGAVTAGQSRVEELIRDLIAERAPADALERALQIRAGKSARRSSMVSASSALLSGR